LSSPLPLLPRPISKRRKYSFYYIETITFDVLKLSLIYREYCSSTAVAPDEMVAT
jgi:hypothetical protein